MSNQKKRVIKGGGGFLVSNILAKGLGFLFIVICSRVLGAADFGILSLGISIVVVIQSLGSFGLPSTIQRYLSGKGEKRAGQLYGSIVILFIFSSVIFSLALFFASPYLSTEVFNEPKLTKVLQVFSAGVFLGTAFKILKAVLQAQEQIKEILIGSSVRSFSKVLFLFILFWTQTAVAATLAYVTATLATLFYLLKAIKNISIIPSLPSKEDVEKVVQHSTPLLFVGFSYLLALQTDRLMIGWLSDSVDVGIYTAVSSLALLMSTFHGSIVAIFMPIASEAYRNNKLEGLNKTYLFISKWIGSINGIILLIFAGTGLFILSIFGVEYSNIITYQILLILSFLYFFGTIAGPTGAFLQMSDGHKLEFYNTIVFIVLNIILNYFFIIKYGLIGAAIGTALSGLVRNMMQLIEIKYFYKLNSLNIDNIVLFLTVATGLLLCYSFKEYRIYLSLLTIAGMSVYISYSLTNEEKLFFRKFKMRLKT